MKRLKKQTIFNFENSLFCMEFTGIYRSGGRALQMSKYRCSNRFNQVLWSMEKRRLGNMAKAKIDSV